MFPPKGAGSAGGAGAADGTEGAASTVGAGAAATGGTLRLSKKALKRRAAEAVATEVEAQAGQGAEQGAGSC